MKNRIKYLLANCYQGQKLHGVQYGPPKLSCFFKNYQSINSNMFYSEKGYELIKDFVLNNLKKKNLPIVIGGDHSISIGSISGSLEKYKNDLSVIWVDAHADINTRESSISKNLHGMPLSFLSSLELNNHSYQKNFLNLSNLHYIGLRDVDEYEKKVIDKHNINYLTSNDIIKNINNLNNLNIKTKYIHLSIDVDVLDTILMPSTGTSVQNGINVSNLIDIIKWAPQQGKIVSVDFVEFNPLIGNKYDCNKSLQNCRIILDNLEKYL